MLSASFVPIRNSTDLTFANLIQLENYMIEDLTFDSPPSPDRDVQGYVNDPVLSSPQIENSH